MFDVFERLIPVLSRFCSIPHQRAICVGKKKPVQRSTLIRYVNSCSPELTVFSAGLKARDGDNQSSSNIYIYIYMLTGLAFIPQYDHVIISH